MTETDRGITQLLLVEDNPGDARLIEEELADARTRGFELAWEQTLKGALQRLAEHPADVVLLDLTLPDSAGMETVDRIHEAAPGTPVVVLTGVEDEELGARAVRGGAQDYLVKDEVDGDRLARSMRYAIERREAQQEVESLRKQVAMSEKLAALGALVAGISQEIRSSTTQITNTIYQLRQRIETAARTNPELRDLADDIEATTSNAIDGVTRIDELVRELRGFTRSGSRAAEEASLDDLVEEAVDLFQRTHQTRITLTADLDPTPPVRINRPQLQQVVINLLTNAAEAMPEGGSIEVETSASDEGGRIVVTDHGTGMTPYVTNRLFEPFFTTKEDAAGLGLAIAARIIDGHGGEIACDSENGVGSTFTVTLPAADGREPIG